MRVHCGLLCAQASKIKINKVLLFLRCLRISQVSVNLYDRSFPIQIRAGMIPQGVKKLFDARFEPETSLSNWITISGSQLEDADNLYQYSTIAIFLELLGFVYYWCFSIVYSSIFIYSLFLYFFFCIYIFLNQYPL